MGPWRHEGIRVVDAHVHVNRFDLMSPGARKLIESNPTFPAMERFVRDPDAFLRHMDAEGVWQAWLVNYGAKDVMGYGWEVNPWAAEYAQADPERLVAIGGYDPHHDGDAGRAVDRLREMGIRGIKVHAVHQRIAPDDLRLEPMYQRAEELRMPVIFHTGTSRFPGADNTYADPTPIAAVLSEHPDLPVILAHGGRPDHTRKAVELVNRFPNAWLDLSSCPPHRLAAYFGDLDVLAPNVLWGSDWPGPGVPGMAANVEAFLRLGLSEEAKRLILHDNAARILDGVR